MLPDNKRDVLQQVKEKNGGGTDYPYPSEIYSNMASNSPDRNMGTSNVARMMGEAITETLEKRYAP